MSRDKNRSSPLDQQYLEILQDDYTWSRFKMLSLVNRSDGKTAVLKHEDGTYILIPGVRLDHPFKIPKNARRGGKDFLRALVSEGWKPEDRLDQEYLEILEDQPGWPYADRIYLRNRDGGNTAILTYENGTYILIPAVLPRDSFKVPKNARRGGSEFLQVLVYQGWKPD
jgi:hypothetical protein